MTLNLELEIKSLLTEFDSPEVVAEKVIKLFENIEVEWSKENLLELYRFLLNCGLYQHLIRFCLSHLADKKFEMPWPYFLQALHDGLPDLEEDIVKFIVLGIQEDNAAESASLADGSERFIKNAKELKLERNRKRRRNSTKLKAEMLDELLTLRTQQLVEQEKNLLGKLQRMFPGDQDILEEVREHKERYALDVLTRRSPLRNSEYKEPQSSPEIRKQFSKLKDSLLTSAKNDPNIAFDFAIAALMFDAPETSLVILESMSLPIERKWLLLEVKLKCRRFLEVLSDLNQIEIALAHEPETFFATAYLRAQAYWGLKQKHVAIEILETILEARPNYRSAHALLDLWRSQ